MGDTSEKTYSFCPILLFQIILSIQKCLSDPQNENL